MKKDPYEHQKIQISTRLTPEEFTQFKKLCFMEFRQMADVARELLQAWIEKNKKKLK